MSHFRNCNYGPWHLRAALRGLLEPGERLIGWGPATQSMDHSIHLALAAVHFVPVIGPLVMAMIVSRVHRFAVLTDRRVLVFPAQAGVLRGAIKKANTKVWKPGLGELAIERVRHGALVYGSASTFKLRWEQDFALKSLTVSARTKRRGGEKRLGAALEALARLDA